MFLKELKELSNGALKNCPEYTTNNQDIQIKLENPATLKSRQKGSHGKWERVLDSSFLDQLWLSVLTGFHVSCLAVEHIRSKSAYTGEVVDLCLDCKAIGGVRSGENTRANPYLK